jgi:dihydroorotase
MEKLQQDPNYLNKLTKKGVISTKLGMKGIPALAEELQVARNLFLLE